MLYHTRVLCYQSKMISHCLLTRIPQVSFGVLFTKKKMIRIQIYINTCELNK